MNIAIKLPDHARVWVYQASRTLTENEAIEIQGMAHDFLTDWNTHGTALSADIQLLHNMFLIVAVDEAVAKASGCSIDKSVRLVKELEVKFGLSLTGRTALAYWDEGKIQTMHFTNFKKGIETKQVSLETVIFNNLIGTVGELRTNWQIKAHQSWLMQVPV